MSNMKRWVTEMQIPRAKLAAELNQSSASITQKLNCKTPWQFADLVALRELYGLSADFVTDFVPYESEAK
ncbi:XRE family transcriptional regulator [Bifidobacterium bifidum]|mgnify:CR=1 FL=1|uniref:Xre-type transcriptional regulator n=3 Tax=Bifidobacterium bifidum TaxID=1681 RepID=I3WIQ7_BIFBI|nr:hypothetical protein [Bifidobacterium bifidum]AFL04770.1 Xre-type transcriptional regulator [Bifidobacterium bifidum BGN4]QRI58184.1 XRE family transcriptional regulator [Bifidobacterium bifidum]RHJ03500.1 XRE family transcriptional regulator [Bifidobacterium bifidum]RHJ25036.1 XRE family transcriptional regulator [Bifidobacterium bifidum]